jgi:hypothetical protein
VGSLAYEKGLDLPELSDAVIDLFTEHCSRKPSPLSVVGMFQRGGALSRVPEDATPFGNRAAKYTLNIVGIAEGLEGFERERAWVRDFWNALRPHVPGRVYVNFLVEHSTDMLRNDVYGPEKYDRLAKIKAEYDPDNLFHLNQNIKPTVPA